MTFLLSAPFVLGAVNSQGKQSVILIDSKKKYKKEFVVEKEKVDDFKKSYDASFAQEKKKISIVLGLFAALGGIAGLAITKKYKEQPYYFSIPAGAFIGGAIGAIVKSIQLGCSNPMQKLTDKFIAENQKSQ